MLRLAKNLKRMTGRYLATKCCNFGIWFCEKMFNSDMNDDGSYNAVEHHANVRKFKSLMVELRAEKAGFKLIPGKKEA